MSSEPRQAQSENASTLSEQIAKTFGIEPQTAAKAIGQIEDKLGFEVQKAMLSRGGLAELVGMLTGPSQNAEGAAAVADGNSILGTLLGGKHQSRGVAGRVARDTGIDVDTAKRILPVVADRYISGLQQQAEPLFAKLLKNDPALAAASRPLSIPGQAPASRPGELDLPQRRGSPLPIPGDNIPGLGRSSPPEPDNPFENLPDIVRRGGTRVPNDGGGGSGGGSLENIIRSILSSILGVPNGGMISNIIRLFLIRFIVNLVRRFLGRLGT